MVPVLGCVGGSRRVHCYDLHQGRDVALASLWRSIPPALGAVASLMLPSGRPLTAQVGNADSGAMQRLYKRYLEQRVSRPDSGLITLRVILAEVSATGADTTWVANAAVAEADMFVGALGTPVVGRLRSDVELDRLTLDNLRTHADSLGIAIGYALLSDSVWATSWKADLLSRSYYARALTRQEVARRINRCNDWVAVYEDTRRLLDYSARVPPSMTAELLPPYRRGPPPPLAPPALADYAASMISARCKQPKPH